jgi:hypothetical protein
MVLESFIFQVNLEFKVLNAGKFKSDVRKTVKWLREDAAFGLTALISTRSSEKNQEVKLVFRCIHFDAYDCIEELKNEIEDATSEAYSSWLCVGVELVRLAKPPHFDELNALRFSKSKAKSGKAFYGLLEILEAEIEKPSPEPTKPTSAQPSKASAVQITSIRSCEADGCQRILLDKSSKYCLNHELNSPKHGFCQARGCTNNTYEKQGKYCFSHMVVHPCSNDTCKVDALTDDEFCYRHR